MLELHRLILIIFLTSQIAFLRVRNLLCFSSESFVFCERKSDFPTLPSLFLYSTTVHRIIPNKKLPLPWSIKPLGQNVTMFWSLPEIPELISPPSFPLASHVYHLLSSRSDLILPFPLASHMSTSCTPAPQTSPLPFLLASQMSPNYSELFQTLIYPIIWPLGGHSLSLFTIYFS